MFSTDRIEKKVKIDTLTLSKYQHMYIYIYMYIYVQNDDFKTIKSDSNEVLILDVSYPKTNVNWY